MPELVDIQAYKNTDKSAQGSELKIALHVGIDETWHINSNNPKDEFLIPTDLEINSNDGIVLTNVIYPKAEDLMFSFSDKPVSVYEGEVFISASLIIPGSVEPGNYPVEIILNYQACNDATCMPPSAISDTINVEIVSDASEAVAINQEIFSKIESESAGSVDSEEDSLADTLESSGLFISLLLVFLGGLALNLTPCVYPLIPITIGYFGGQSEGSTSRLFVLGLVYVFGMALTYSVIGVVTAMSGAVFGALLQNPIVVIIIALVLVGLSLSMFGVYEFKLPDGLVARAGGAKAGVAGAFIMGLTLGIVAAPCIGPFVLGLLTYVAAKADVFLGFIMFFTLALGLGAPYLVLALFSGKIKNLPRAGFWMDGVKHIFGLLLVGMAIYFITPLLPKTFGGYLLPVFMIGSALFLLFIDKVGNDVKGFRIVKIVFSVLILAVSVYSIIPQEKLSPEWQEYSDQLYEDALTNNKKIMIDFYADWCIPCKEYDALTFTDERVISLSKDFVNIKVDMTKTMSDETEKLRNKFSVVGMPTILFFDSNGEEIERLSGFLNADEFLKIMNAIN
jgi:thiol:disulfide interchange protein DsbD